ncbi:MAG: L,D-transpeptidase family protein [Sulfurovaceae bacterium]|nr:L,D-transpeptidase family protein [Sulfurovaceae bacterium]
MKLIIFVSIVLWISGCSMKKDFYVPPRDDTEPRYDVTECVKKLSKKQKVPPNKKIDKIVIYKSKKIMQLYKNGNIYKQFPVSLSKNSTKGHKMQDGDGKTPEGLYTIYSMRCHDRRYKAMYISYPNAKDKARARILGVDPGGYVSIHGQPKWNANGNGDKYSLKYDWTKGCIGVPNKTMDVLWAYVERGTPIQINP